MSTRVYQRRPKAGDPYDLAGGPKKWHWKEPTGYLFSDAWLQLGRQELPVTQWRVLCGLMGHCDWNNRCRCSYGGLGRSLGMARSSVARAMRGLVSARLVCCARQRTGQPYEITLSPSLCWKGRPWHLARARQDFLARWRLQHGQGGGPGLSPPLHEDEASPGVGENALGEVPSFPSHLNGRLSSV